MATRLYFMLFVLSIAANATPSDFDCPMKQLLLEYAQEINPTLTRQQLQYVADALNGSPLALVNKCNVTVPSSYVPQPKPISNADTMNTVYVDVSNGDDINDGLSLQSPLKTIQKAIYYARNIFGPNKFKQILLREGTYYLGSTVYLNHLDSNLLIKSYQDEYVNVSGAVPLRGLEWKLYDTKNGNRIYYTPINTNLTDQPYGLRVNGFRAIRARYPNVISEEAFPPETYNDFPIKWITETGTVQSQYVYNVSEFVRNDTSPVKDDMPGGYTTYWLTVGGKWLNKLVPPGAPPRFSQVYAVGFEYDKTILPNSPYKNLSGAIVRAFMQLHWNSWMWQVDPDNSNDRQIRFLDWGGMQGSQGGTCDTFFIENVFEELDAVNEWIYVENEKRLYFVPNISANEDWVKDTYDVTQLKVLFEAIGNQSHPVKNVSFDGMAFIDTVYTYLDNHGCPSAGDWAFQYSGAITLEGTENVSITNSLFSRLDGNGIYLFGYNRYAQISYNEFAFIGDSCIGSWGNTEGYTFKPPPDAPRYAKLGINGTAGDQPRFSNISYNLAHEIGINEKQSSFYFQAVSCENYIGHNVVFNGPRAGINFNDGFGGNNNVDGNIVFNMCRESSDHGPFNSWDRVPYITKVATGQQSITPAFNHLHKNFFISNYGAQYQIDNDDVSQFYHSDSNFLVYGTWAFKSNYGGHDIHHYNNIYGYPLQCMQLYDVHPYPQNKNIMVGNTCVVNGSVQHGKQVFNAAFIGPDFNDPDCNWAQIYPVNKGGWLAANNTFMVGGGTMDNAGYCGVSLSDLQKHGTEMGSTMSGWPETSALIQQARNLLWN